MALRSHLMMYRPSATAASSGLRWLLPWTLPVALWQHRFLISQVTRREIQGRYRSSALGLAWSFITPLTMLAIYTFVFGLVLHARWPGDTSGSLLRYATILFWGITAFTLFSDTVNRSARLVSANPNYVKKVVFPLEILSVSLLGSVLFQAGISLVLLIVAEVLANGAIPLTVLLLPIAVLPLIFLSLASSWVLASLGVFIPDVEHTAALVTQVLFFVTPVLYPLESIPEPFRGVLVFNPLTGIVEDIRGVAMWGTSPDFLALGLRIVLTYLAMVLSYGWFLKTKTAFADVI